MLVAASGIPDVKRADLDAEVRATRSSATRGQRTWHLGSAGVALRIAPRLGLVLAAVALVHVGIISGYTFLSLRLVELGGSPSDVALAAGLSAAAEIPSMLVMGWVVARIGLRGVFTVSALIFAACFASWAIVEVPAFIIASRLFTGVAFAGVVVGVVLTIVTLLPAELQATGQALFQTTAFGIAAILANVVGGYLYGAVGPAAVFGLGAVLAAVGAAVGWFVFPRRVGSSVRQSPS
jgi:MFS family permease